MLDLSTLGPRYHTQYGEEKIADIAGVTLTTVRSWVAKDRWPLDAVNKLLAFDPVPIHEIKPLYGNPSSGDKIAVILPSNRSTDPRVFEAVMRMYDPKYMQIKSFMFNNLNVVRNMAAAWFLGTNCPISYWNDDDVIVPFGDAKAFKEICDLPAFPDLYGGMSTIARLLSHQKKIIGVSYVGRKRGVGPQMSMANPAAGRADYARGPRDIIIPRDWIGMGGTMIMREVFTDIAKACPEIRLPDGHQLRAYYEFGFFDASPGIPGDDINFCARAKKAGHEIFADLSLMASHVGTKCFNFEDAR